MLHVLIILSSDSSSSLDEYQPHEKRVCSHNAPLQLDAECERMAHLDPFAFKQMFDMIKCHHQSDVTAFNYLLQIVLKCMDKAKGLEYIARRIIFDTAFDVGQFLDVLVHINAHGFVFNICMINALMEYSLANLNNRPFNVFVLHSIVNKLNAQQINDVNEHTLTMFCHRSIQWPTSFLPASAWAAGH